MAEARIGTSGWIYRHWRRGAFYPEGLRQKLEFQHYASLFDTVEINGSFYRTPGETSARQWRDQAPEAFLYAWKYPRWLTHFYRLRNPEESFRLVFGRMKPLGGNAGPVLFQLPPHMQRDPSRLAGALKLLPRGQRAAFEFRHPSWYAKDILDLLQDHDAALCISDHHHAPAPWIRTASWVYVRGHGPGGTYHGSYGDHELRKWARHVRTWRKSGADI
ncbi:MAG: DUF72 domain-containing protein, partial [Alphaproteobacteria bacterium]